MYLYCAEEAAALPPTRDPDSLIPCDIMDGRDAFIMWAREKRYEFSSLRHCRYTTTALLYEVHQLQLDGCDQASVMCNGCGEQTDTYLHCPVCEVRCERQFTIILPSGSLATVCFRLILGVIII